MVGRESELRVLQAAFEATIAERRAHAVTVAGEAGLGKSRLVTEFQQSLDLRTCWLLAGHAHPRGAVHPYGLLRDMLIRHLEIGEWDAAAPAERKLTEGLGPLFVEEGEAPIHLLGQLIGLDFSTRPHVAELLRNERQFKARAFEAGALYLRRLGDRRPVVMVLDDLHWADDSSLEFIGFAVRRNVDVPLLSVMLTRPSFFEQHADWTEGDGPHIRLDLKPLDQGFSRELAEDLLQRVAEAPAALRALVTDRAEGNPFYMEELVKMFIDDGVIVADAEGWRVLPDKLLATRVPPTLTGLLHARLDALGTRERSALQQAAVVGHVFLDEALAAIDPGAVDHLSR
jgi:predicted ATPase